VAESSVGRGTEKFLHLKIWTWSTRNQGLTTRPQETFSARVLGVKIYPVEYIPVSPVSILQWCSWFVLLVFGVQKQRRENYLARQQVEGAESLWCSVLKMSSPFNPQFKVERMLQWWCYINLDFTLQMQFWESVTYMWSKVVCSKLCFSGFNWQVSTSGRIFFPSAWSQQGYPLYPPNLIWVNGKLRSCTGFYLEHLYS
jgi:hypothetical protein